MSLANAALQRVPPGARRLIRRAGDPLLAPIGSVRGARTTDRVMALTFDDGPDPDVTPRVLDALAAA
ncbi:MAG TPA: polysaccharide deacetylase family protein, partial [Acidimicrobiales bacterium]|nr:polysaccharide deacetylase family protein [Acidimicrobiales bacterium]